MRSSPIEEETILEKLRKMGVDYAQGYAIACPIPINFQLMTL
ncbi:hypothetical protein [Pseudanabaena sp. SR411]|nr:hypothetical protein [Pseudanabaena sp. SR411]